MKKIISIFSLLFLISTIGYSQTKSNESISVQIKSLKIEKKIVLDYDKAGNFTKIMAFGEDFGREQNKSNNLSKFSFGMMFNYAGTTLTNEPFSFVTTFWAEGKKAAFATAHNLTITIDNENIDLVEARYATKAGDNREFLNFNFPRDVLVKIVNGKNVQMKIGNANFKFTPEHLKLFAGLLAISSAK